MNAQTRVRMDRLKSHVGLNCKDGVINHLETDVDCGGGICNPCTAGRACMLHQDCESGVCQSSICLAGEESKDQQLSVLQAQNAKLVEELSQRKKERRIEQQQQEEEDLSDYDDVDYDDEATTSFQEIDSNAQVIQSHDKWNSSCAERPGPGRWKNQH